MNQMKRIRMLGLCVVAVFAISAITVAVAQAELPEYKICEKLPNDQKGKGQYALNCLGGMVKAGDYELVEWNASSKERKFKVDSKTEVWLTAYEEPVGYELGVNGVANGRAECTKAKGEGEIIGPKEDKIVDLTLSGCRSRGFACTGSGEKAGTIVIPNIVGVLGYEALPPPPPKTVTAVEIEYSNFFANWTTFNCGATQYKMFGHVIGVVTGPINMPRLAELANFRVNARNEQEQMRINNALLSNPLKGEETVTSTPFGMGLAGQLGVKGGKAVVIEA